MGLKMAVIRFAIAVVLLLISWGLSYAQLNQNSGVFSLSAAGPATPKIVIVSVFDVTRNTGSNYSF